MRRPTRWHLLRIDSLADFSRGAGGGGGYEEYGHRWELSGNGEWNPQAIDLEVLLAKDNVASKLACVYMISPGLSALPILPVKSLIIP